MEQDISTDKIEKKLNKKFSYSKGMLLFPDILLTGTIICLYVFIIWTMSYYNTYPESSISFGDIFTVFGIVIAAECTFAGIAHVAYSNKTKFENCMKIRFSFVEKLLRLKKKLELYPKDELQSMIDSSILNAEQETNDMLASKSQEAEISQDNISV